MLNRLKTDRLDPELYLNEMTRAHLNRGVIALMPRINDLSNFYELVKEERHAASDGVTPDDDPGWDPSTI